MKSDQFAEILEALAPLGKTLPACGPEASAKIEACIEKLKGDPAVNPWPVCQSSLGCAIPWALELLFSDDEGEQKFIIVTNPTIADRIVEALELAGKPAG